MEEVFGKAPQLRTRFGRGFEVEAGCNLGTEIKKGLALAGNEMHCSGRLNRRLIHLSLLPSQEKTR